MSSLPPKNKAFVTAAKNYKKTDIQVFWFFPFLFDLLTLIHYLFPGLCSMLLNLCFQYYVIRKRNLLGSFREILLQSRA